MQVLITDEVHPLLPDGLQARGYQVTYSPQISFEETLAVIDTYIGLVVNSKIFCGEELLQRASNLQWIARLGSGLEVIDAELCRANGIRFFNTPEGNSQAVAEHALGALLTLMRNLTKANIEVKQGNWLREINRGEELSGKSVGIIGFGHTGEAFANVLKGFDVHILAHDKYRKNFGSERVQEASLQQIFEQANVISLHLPLTAETTYYASHTFFEALQQPIYFINTSRGKIVNTNALLTAMDNKKVKAAALDVLENENLQKFTELQKGWWRELVSSERILLTPHIAGWTYESKQKIAEAVLRKVDAL